MSLNNEQLHAFSLFKSGKSIFITGPGGCGKSFLINHIKQYCHENSLSIALTALTGCASNIICGQTLHGWAGIGLAKGSSADIVNSIVRRPVFYKRWRTTQVLIIDEISMMSMELFNKLHLIGQDIRNNKLFFGGIQMVLCGDFAQLEPIGSDKLCFESQIWLQNITVDNTIYLSKIIRQEDPVFQKLLSNIRLGIVTEEDKALLNSRLMTDETDSNVLIVNSDNNVKATVKATVLYPLKKDVNRINEEELAKLIASGEIPKTYHCNDYTYNKKTRRELAIGNNKTQIDQLNKCTNAPEQLIVAVGAQVMLTKNKDVINGLVNGSRGVILELRADGPLVMFDNGMEITVVKETFEIENGDTIIGRRQVPLILAWALTIHKCQGSTLTNVITDLSDIFGYSQAYVTLSRVKTLEGLFIANINYNRIKCNPKVKKYYTDLLASFSNRIPDC